jgi:transposase
MFKGSLTGEVFKAYVREQLAPSLKKDDIVIIDNLSVHKTKGALDPIYEKGATVIFLPPYSPDLNPIELAWSKIKSILKKLKPRSLCELFKSMKTAIESITLTDIYNWFAFQGYCIGFVIRSTFWYRYLFLFYLHYNF